MSEVLSAAGEWSPVPAGGRGEQPLSVCACGVPTVEYFELLAIHSATHALIHSAVHWVFVHSPVLLLSIHETLLRMLCWGWITYSCMFLFFCLSFSVK